VYDFRGNVNPFEPSGPSRLQQVPRGSDVELNDYSNPQTNAINYIPPSKKITLSIMEKFRSKGN